MKTLFPTDFQLHLFHEGTLYESHQLFGAHVISIGGKVFTRFCVWAPNAEIIRLVGDFNDWNGEGYTLHRVNNEGVWIIQLDGDMEGALYKYEITTKKGERLLKADPYSFFSEVRPNTASKVYSLDGYQWNDGKWMQKKKRSQFLQSLLSFMRSILVRGSKKNRVVSTRTGSLQVN